MRLLQACSQMILSLLMQKSGYSKLTMSRTPQKVLLLEKELEGVEMRLKKSW